MRNGFNPITGLLTIPTSRYGVPHYANLSGFNPITGLLTIPTLFSCSSTSVSGCFNPITGLLTIPTTHRLYEDFLSHWFQSHHRASDNSDQLTASRASPSSISFNPITGLLTIPTNLRNSKRKFHLKVSIPSPGF